MVALNFNSSCKEAELYYYDFLCKEGQKLVPQFALDHIKECKYCQKQLSELSRVLSITESHIEPEQEQVSSASTTMLKLHLACIGKPVTCETVKPFLPSLLDPALEIRIPTPITVHIDNCHKCSEDLETLQRLNLTRKQLRRLSQLFADKPEESNISCTEAQNAVSSVVSIVLDEIDSEVLKHLCICPDCRRLLYQRREMILRGLLKTKPTENKFRCEKVSARVFFDYAIPYGTDTANDQSAKFHESLTSHLRICPTCLAKMQELHNTVYRICERTESEVVTVYHVDESAKAQATSGTEELYAGFPIRVDVKQREEEVKAEQLVPTTDFVAALKRKVPVKKLKPLLKTATVAAAIILMAVVLFQNTPTAKAVTLERIYRAIERIRNVHVTRFAPYKTEPVQEKWVSRTLNIYMTKTGKQRILWDINNGVTRMKYLDDGTAKATKLTAENIADIEKKITGSLGLMPFYGISDVPKDADWSRTTDKELEAAVKDIEIYDLTWTERAYDGSTVSKKWRFFVNAQGDIPQRIEIYQMLPADAEYTLEASMVVEYLNDGEMQAVVKKASF
jgi:hypothetical protein